MIWEFAHCKINFLIMIDDVCSGNPGESHEDSTQSGNQWWLDLAHAFSDSESFQPDLPGMVLKLQFGMVFRLILYIYTYIYISYIIYNITIYFITFHHISSLHHIFKPPGISTLGPSNPDRTAMVLTRQRDLCAAHGGPNPPSVGLLPRGELPW